MNRIACIWMPQFELQVRLREQPELRDYPVVIAEIGAQRAHVVHASALAQRAGIQPGLPLSMARAALPELVIVPPDAARLQPVREALATVLYRFAPIIGSDGRECFFLGLEGLERLYPDEERYAQTLRQTLLHDFELECTIAIADSAVAAWAVARATAPGRARIVARGEDRQALGRLPIDTLAVPQELQRLCQILGLSWVGELQRLPPGALLRRFGRAGEDVEQQLRGRSDKLFRQLVPTAVEQSELHLDQVTDELEPLLFLHKTVLDALLEQVAALRRVIAVIELTLTLADRERSQLVQHFRAADPTLDGRVWLDLITLWLTSQPAAGPVETIRMRATEVALPAPRQLRLWDQAQDSLDQSWQLALSRLVAAFGHQAIVQPELCDRYLPEGRLRWRSVTTHDRDRTAAAPADDQARCSGATATEKPVAVLRLLDPSLQLECRGKRLRICGSARWQRIVARDELCTVEGEWWDAGFRREYTTVSTDQDETWWIFRDEQGRYYLQAYLD